MMSQETLEAVRKGILTDVQLKEAIEHYSILAKFLSIHRGIYYHVWRDVNMQIDSLKHYQLVNEKWIRFDLINNTSVKT